MCIGVQIQDPDPYIDTQFVRLRALLFENGHAAPGGLARLVLGRTLAANAQFALFRP